MRAMNQPPRMSAFGSHNHLNGPEFRSLTIDSPHPRTWLGVRPSRLLIRDIMQHNVEFYSLAPFKNSAAAPR
jgi:hypothetical protein